MEFFLDTADVEVIREFKETGLINGITTNPSLVAKSGKDFKKILKEISKMIKGPISAEVTAIECKGMIAEAKILSKISKNIVIKWVHRFGIDSLNDLLIYSQVQEGNHEEENQEQISLIDEVHEENQEQIKLELSKTFENIEETKWESNGLETSSSNEISSKNKNSNKINQFTETPKLPLPYIKNLRKWINNDKKAS